MQGGDAVERHREHRKTLLLLLIVAMTITTITMITMMTVEYLNQRLQLINTIGDIQGASALKSHELLWLEIVSIRIRNIKKT